MLNLHPHTRRPFSDRLRHFGLEMYFLCVSIIKYLLFLLEFVLILRMLLKFLAANSETIIVKEIYKLTDFFIFPFQSIFPDFYFKGMLVDISAFSAMIGYFIVVALFLKLLEIILIRNKGK